jgi:hypothetical protein
MTAICPKSKEHESTDPKFCSVCGTKIATAEARSRKEAHGPTVEIPKPSLVVDAAIPAAISADSKSGEVQTSREPDSKQAQAQTAATKQGWEILVVVDPSLYKHPIPNTDCPTEPEKVFPLNIGESLIGRLSESKKIYPDLSINDPGISHRHFKLIKDKDNFIFLLDVGSANGTTLNETLVSPGEKKPLNAGDQITLGCWTRITIQRADL